MDLVVGLLLGIACGFGTGVYIGRKTKPAVVRGLTLDELINFTTYGSEPFTDAAVAIYGAFPDAIHSLFQKVWHEAAMRDELDIEIRPVATGIVRSLLISNGDTPVPELMRRILADQALAQGVVAQARNEGHPVESRDDWEESRTRHAAVVTEYLERQAHVRSEPDA